MIYKLLKILIKFSKNILKMKKENRCLVINQCQKNFQIMNQIAFQIYLGIVIVEEDLRILVFKINKNL